MDYVEWQYVPCYVTILLVFGPLISTFHRCFITDLPSREQWSLLLRCGYASRDFLIDIFSNVKRITTSFWRLLDLPSAMFFGWFLAEGDLLTFKLVISLYFLRHTQSPRKPLTFTTHLQFPITGKLLHSYTLNCETAKEVLHLPYHIKATVKILAKVQGPTHQTTFLESCFFVYERLPCQYIYLKTFLIYPLPHNLSGWYTGFFLGL